MIKAVYTPQELITVTDKIVLDSPTEYPELSHFKTMEEPEDIMDAIEEYTGPTADDLRREAEMFKRDWEEEKERMIANAKEEAENIIQQAQKAAFAEVKRQTDEAQVIRQQAEEEAERILAEAKVKISEMENEVRQNLEAERTQARNRGAEEGKEAGFAEGKAEVDRLIERTQTVLERAQDKRAEILSEAEKQIVDLVLLISRKVVKILSENQRDVIIQNVVQALRKVKSKGNIIIRVNLADLKLATEHKQNFIQLMEGAKSVQVIEDSTVDRGGCIIETDFGEIDARISSQLAEMEAMILGISPAVKANTPPPVVKTANLFADLAASTALMQETAQAPLLDRQNDAEPDDGKTEESEEDMSPAANAALTASAALAALTTMAVKGKRKSDQVIKEQAENALAKPIERRT